VSLLTRLIGRLNLRFPTLFALFALLTALDLVLRIRCRWSTSSGSPS
jgi:hypothetical protein